MGLSMTAFYLALGIMFIPVMYLLISIFNSSVFHSFMAGFLAIGTYLLIYFLDNSRIIKSIADKKIPIHVINDPFKDDSTK